MSSPMILVVDDDSPLREVVRTALTFNGFDVIEATDGPTALRRVAEAAIDLCVLDVGMPGMDGFAVCRALRALPGGGPPVLFLTARDDEIDRIVGLELGGDDYVTKPFSPRELASRVKAILRRTRPAEAPAAPASGRRLGPVRIDEEQRRVWVNVDEVVLTATEHDLFVALTHRPGRVYTRDELVEAAYGIGHHISDRTVDSHLRRVRQKLAQAGCDCVRTQHGVGYKFSLEDG